MIQLKSIYEKLYSHFGSQGWWPVTPTGCRGPENTPVYGVSTRTEKQRFEVMVGAILTQNTSWKNVEKAIINLNKENLIDPIKIKNINIKKLASVIRPSGYYNQKAKKLKNLADFIIKNRISGLLKEDANSLRNKLLSINGVGPETADSILLYALDKPIFVIDAYTKRIFSRLCCKGQSYEELQSMFISNLPHDSRMFNEYHALLVELGKRHCAKKQVCEGCPIAVLCSANQ